MSGIYPAAARVFRPWKNGGGETAEILCWPEGAGFDDFTLRLSTARVDRSGPFSLFPGVDRVLTVIEGGAMVLTFDGTDHPLAPGSALAFAGDAPCTARLDGSPLLDFNVMTRRPLQAQVTVGPLTADARFAMLLAPAAGLARLDLVDLDLAETDLVAHLIGTPVIAIHLPRA
ncbi:HutD/Ves family protein [Pseudotabrizicola alkalilacus]|uniref:HutD family protein n=1 Tax=Pseudotabrizicola alkalilacus TaxID=2305252 RepID=A0A411YYF7_9RHOB|nr:HutD family protein [Pseudotabrizicola alkalilacus]RGP35783.1 HutD family protein [Pseudotabrizicola alkalilacus]